MAKFLTGNKLNTEIENLFEKAESRLILISPYIKLHDRYVSVLRTKKENPKLHITVVFGKNEENPSKSMRQEDLNFFKEFPNVDILFEKRLHAKYYANESSAIMTSMNLYDYSQDNNIEAGVLTNTSSYFGGIASNIISSDNYDAEAWNYFVRVMDQADVIYRKLPDYETTLLGLSKKYKGSRVEEDNIAEFFTNKQKFENKPRKVYFEKIESAVKIAPINKEVGYCIRTGKNIPFNPKRPLSDEGYQSWARYKNETFQEKYCHFSGEESHGETSFAKPILRKNWKKAKEQFSDVIF